MIQNFYGWVILKYFNQLYSLNRATFYFSFNFGKLVHYISGAILESLQVFIYDMKFSWVMCTW